VATDWLKVQSEYLHTPVSLQRLAEKHGISHSTLKRRAAKEGWAAQKKAGKTLADEPATPCETAFGVVPVGNGCSGTGYAAAAWETVAPYDTSPVCDTGRLTQLQAIGDQLTAQLAQAVKDLNKQVVQHKRRTKEMTYGDLESHGKPIEETTEEEVLSETIEVPVSSLGVHRLSTALKILREVTLADSGDGQSLKLVAELMKKLDSEAGKEAEAHAGDE
jgi:hypothetical protein